MSIALTYSRVSNKEVPVHVSLHSFDAPLKAARAVRALVADPDDLPQVFTVLEALSGDTLGRLVRRLGESARGRRLLAERPEIVPLLEDREALRSLPAGSLGRAYLEFMEAEAISAAGIQEADARGRSEPGEIPPDQAYVFRRMRDAHDLWHAVTGYRGDVLGETALLAFTLAQTKNPGVALLVAVGLYKTQGGPARALIVDGFRRGQRAAWLPEQEWEAMLARPLAEVRAELRVSAPPVYIPIRSADLRAAAAA
jgi:ubiquinone biosynthesis protein COQ4